MDMQRLSAILLIAAFVCVFFLGMLTNVPGLYATQDIQFRLQITETYKTHWLFNRAWAILYILLTTSGFAVLASTLRTPGKAWVPVLGAAAYVIGSISGTISLFFQTIDPRGGYSGAYPAPEALAYWFWLGGLLLLGVAFLQDCLPTWLGYVTSGAALVYGIFYLVTGVGFLTPFLVALLSLWIAVVLMSNKNKRLMRQPG
jgi:hypothetical protein